MVDKDSQEKKLALDKSLGKLDTKVCKRKCLLHKLCKLK